MLAELSLIVIEATEPLLQTLPTVARVTPETASVYVPLILAKTEAMAGATILSTAALTNNFVALMPKAEAGPAWVMAVNLLL